MLFLKFVDPDCVILLDACFILAQRDLKEIFHRISPSISFANFDMMGSI